MLLKLFGIKNDAGKAKNIKLSLRLAISLRASLAIRCK